MSRQPRAFRLDDPEVVTIRPGEPAGGRSGAAVIVTEDPLETIEAADGARVPVRQKRGVSFGGILLSALGSLMTLAIGLGLERLIADLFAIAPWLGWLGLALAAIALIAFIGLVAREVAGVFREHRIERLRAAAIDALAVRDHATAKRIGGEVIALYAGRAAAGGRERLAASSDEIMDADDRLALVEHELVAPLDVQAKRAIARAAKQVSVVTAVSPRAIVDVAFVVFAAVRLLRRISTIYGGRPGLLGFLRLARAAFGHLAVTGGVAVGDSLVQQVLGLGLAAKISAKLGEGVLNGLMTARFGLAALAVCRPLPFIREEAPKIGDVAGELLSNADEAIR